MRHGIAKAVGDAIGPGNILVGFNKGLEAVEIINQGGISNMVPVALGAMVADTANLEIIEARPTVGGGENRELIGADGIIVEDKKASTGTWRWGGCGGSRVAATGGWAGSGSLGCWSASSCWTGGGASVGASRLVGQAIGVGSLVVRFASLINTNGQVVEMVLPTGKEVFHVF